MKLIQVTEVGGPEQLKLAEAPMPTPGPKEALVRIAAAGVNFIDVYFRIGLYKADLPLTPGNEGAGTVEAVGADFYGANCHKWLLAPTGSGFLYLGPGAAGRIEPLQVSWGWRADGAKPLFARMNAISAS